MKRWAALFAAVLVIFSVGLAFAGPAPKGLEVTTVFPDGDTPIKVRVAQKARQGYSVAATLLSFAASDSVRAYIPGSSDFLPPGDQPLGDFDYEVNGQLRYSPGSPPTVVGGSINEVWLYGPAAGGSVTVYIWCEY